MGNNMAISHAVQRGNTVHVFDERGRKLFAISNYTLIGFTSTTVSMKIGNQTHVYNDRGRKIYAGN